MLVRKKLEKHYRKANKFLRSDSLDKWYFMGWLLADGHISIRDKEKNYYRWNLTTVDKDVLFKFADKLDLPVYKYKNKSNGKEYERFQFECGRRDLGKYLYKLFGNNKSKCYETFKDIKCSYKKAFLTGYIDGDGSINIDKNNYLKVIISCGKNEKKVLKLIKKFLDDLGVFYNLLDKTEVKGVYLISVNSQNDVRKIKDKLYNNQIYFKRKKRKLNKVRDKDKIRCLSVMEREKIKSEIEKDYGSPYEIDIRILSEKYNLNKSTLRHWIYNEIFNEYNGKEVHANKRKRDEKGRFI